MPSINPMEAFVVRHRSTIPGKAGRSAPQPASNSVVTLSSPNATDTFTKPTVTTCEGATGVAGGLHLYFPENEEPIAVADGGWNARPFTDKDLWRLSAIVCKLLDASHIRVGVDIGSLQILFRVPEDALWVNDTLAEMRR